MRQAKILAIALVLTAGAASAQFVVSGDDAKKA